MLDTGLVSSAACGTVKHSSRSQTKRGTRLDSAYGSWLKRIRPCFVRVCWQVGHSLWPSCQTSPGAQCSHTSIVQDGAHRCRKRWQTRERPKKGVQWSLIDLGGRFYKMNHRRLGQNRQGQYRYPSPCNSMLLQVERQSTFGLRAPEGLKEVSLCQEEAQFNSLRQRTAHVPRLNLGASQARLTCFHNLIPTSTTCCLVDQSE